MSRRNAEGYRTECGSCGLDMHAGPCDRRVLSLAAEKKRKKSKRRTLRSLTLDELRARYDRAVVRALKAAGRAERLWVIIKRREKPARATAARLAGEATDGQA